MRETQMLCRQQNNVMEQRLRALQLRLVWNQESPMREQRINIHLEGLWKKKLYSFFLTRKLTMLLGERGVYWRHVKVHFKSAVILSEVINSANKKKWKQSNLWQYRNPRAQGCSNLSVVRVLLRAWGVLKCVDQKQYDYFTVNYFYAETTIWPMRL